MAHEDGITQPKSNGTLDSNSDSKHDPNASELDPCLDSKNPTNKKLPFYEKYISNVQEKTSLDRKWFLIVAGLIIGLILLFIAVLGMAVGWAKVPHMYRYPICREPACLRAAAQIQENLNNSVSPCIDLWGSVCSKWSKKSILPKDRAIWNQKEEIVQQESERLRDFISSMELPLQIGSVEWKFKYFYEACLNVDNVNAYQQFPLTNIISELGSWYILPDWSHAGFDGKDLITKLHVRYGVSPFFKIHVEPDPHVPNTHIIRISPSGLGLPDRDYYFGDDSQRLQNAYMDYIRDVVMYLSSTRNDATKFGRDIFNYEKRIAEITPDRNSLQNPITTYNAISLAELKDPDLMLFYNILQAMYPEASISDNTEVIVTSLEYLHQVSQVIYSTDRRTMNGYLIWTLVRQYIPFLSQNFTSTMDAFNAELFGVSKPKQRWQMCIDMVRNYMGFAAEYFLEKTFPISEDTKNIVNATFKNILGVVKSKIQKFDNTALLLQHLETKVNLLSLHIGLPQGTKTSKFLKDFYTPLQIIKTSLFEGVKNSIEFKKRIDQKMLHQTLPEGVFLRAILDPVPKVRYIPSKNAIVVPRSLLMQPYYEDNFPSSIIYGRLGKEIAEAIMSSILPFGSFWTADKKILSPFHMTVNESLKSVQPATACIAQYLSSLQLDIPSNRIDNTALGILTELSAVKVAKEALFRILPREHIHYGGLEPFEDDALYFLTYAQSQCSESTSQYQIYENLVDFRVSQKSVLHVAWSQLSDFQKAFDCTPNKKVECDGIF